MAEVSLKVAARLANRSAGHVRRLLLEGKIQGRQVEDVHGPAWRIDQDSLHAYFAPGWPLSRAQELRELREDVQLLARAVDSLRQAVQELS